METGLLHLHNFMRWLVLLFALLTLVKGIGGMSGTKKFTANDKRSAMFLMICCDIQLLLGLALYFMNGWLGNLMNTPDAMKNTTIRFYSVEHAFGMLVAIILIHIGYAAVKKDIPDKSKFSRMFWFTFIALIIIIVMIPWPWREMIGRPLF